MKFWFNESFSNHKYVWLYQDSLKIQDKNCINLPMQLVYMSELGFNCCRLFYSFSSDATCIYEWIGILHSTHEWSKYQWCNLYIWVNWDFWPPDNCPICWDATCIYEWIGIMINGKGYLALLDATCIYEWIGIKKRRSVEQWTEMQLVCMSELG